MELEGQGDSGFEVFSGTDYYGNHSYEDLPLVIENFSGSGNLMIMSPYAIMISTMLRDFDFRGFVMQ
jgi:hypothetical protein